MRRIAVPFIVAALATCPFVRSADSAATSGDASADAAQLARQFDELEKALRATPCDRFDPQAVVELVGRDPEKLAAWVRDTTALFPYRGALRGPVGTLMDRGGNSLDRSLLLADLLQAVGQETRLANATLSDDQAKQLVQAVMSAATSPPRDAGATASNEPTPQAQQARQRVRTQADQLMNLL